MRKYTALVGCLFDDIYIEQEGNEALIKVPITYAPKDKMLARVLEDPSIAKQTAITLPIISFEIGQIKYDGDRKLHTTGKNSIRLDTQVANKLRYQYMPVPYNIAFKVYIYAKNVEDANRIVEQILPFFTPDWTTSVKLIPEMSVTLDIPVVLNNLSYTDNYSGTSAEAYGERRAIVWELDLVLKGYLYGPIKRNAIIQFANVSFYAPRNVAPHRLYTSVGNTPVTDSVTVQPGLTTNGEPTQDINYTIPYEEIWANTNYDFITQL